MPTNDYYSILGVSRNATSAEIKTAYKKLAKKHHPDVSKSSDSHDKFKEISRAYQVLSDADKRAAYDRMGHAGFEQARKSGFTGSSRGEAGGFGQGGVNYEDIFGGGGGFRDPFDIFEEFFGGRGSSGRGGFGGRSPQSNLRGRDLEVVVSLSFDEAVHGTKKEVAYDAYGVCDRCAGSGSNAKSSASTTCSQCGGSGQVRNTQSLFGASFSQIAVCPTCQGSGQVIKDPCSKCGGEGRAQARQKMSISVPAGVDTGTRIRYSGKGEAGRRGHTAGDLYVVFKVLPHKQFERRGQDIILSAEISPTQAVLGTQIEVPTIDGDKKLKIPAGIQPGQPLKLSGRGVPYLNSTRRGDQIVVVNIKVPAKLSRKQKDLYQKLLETENQPPSFINKFFA